MDLVDFHMLVSSSERERVMDDIAKAIGPDGKISLMARRTDDTILRIEAPTDCYLYLKLKYDKEKIWLR